MVLGTVRRKLTALVALSAVASLVGLVTLSWIVRRQLIDEVDDRVPEAIRGFDRELADDIIDLDVTARALSTQADVARALAAGDVRALEAFARPFHDAYPDIDIVFYDRSGRFVATLGCDHPRPATPVIDAAHVVLEHGCESDPHAPAAIAVARPIGDAGLIVACLPLDTPYFENAREKLGIDLALRRGRELQYLSPGFPRDALDEARVEGNIVDDADRTFAVARFRPAPLSATPSEAVLEFTAALDVTDVKAIVHRHLLVSFGVVGVATLAALALGWRLASRMSRALTRVTGAMRRLERQEYVKVDVLQTGDELEDLAVGFNDMVDGLQERDKLKTTMGKYMTAQVMSHVLAGEVELGGVLLEVTILFCDLRNFTALAEKRTAHDIVELLNEYFTEMVAVITAEGGVVDKYIGDNIMAVFGAPVTRADDAVRATRAAIGMREALARLNARFVTRNGPELRFGIGLHTGEVVAGNIGSPSRMEYTVIGDAVNVASRLESATKELATDILISEATRVAAGDAVVAEAIAEIAVKGREQPVQVYTIARTTPR
jgi:adenylate cyclase